MGPWIAWITSRMLHSVERVPEGCAWPASDNKTPQWQYSSSFEDQSVTLLHGWCRRIFNVSTALVFVMAALCNRAGHYIFALWFLLSFYLFSSPNLSHHRLDVCHTSTHGVALMRILPAHVFQCVRHSDAMCSRAWRSQWPRIDSSLGPGASAY